MCFVYNNAFFNMLLYLMKGLGIEFENPWCWKQELVFASIILESLLLHLQFLVCFFRPDSRWWLFPPESLIWREKPFLTSPVKLREQAAVEI